MIKPTVYIDMDNTLNKFWIPYIQYYNRLFNKNASLDPSIMTNYSLSICLGLEKGSKEESLLDEATMCSWKFWTDDMPPYEEAPEVLERMCQKYNVYILSTPYVEYIKCIPAKMEWMEKHFPFFPKKNMIFTWHKELLRGDFLVDDKPENLIGFKGKVATIEYPYNKYVGGVYCGKNWYDIENWIKNMTSEDDVEKEYGHLF